MNLISQWYTPKDDRRLREITVARKANEESGLFESITYLDGDKKRWSFRELFDFASEQHDGEICVVANTDIVFDVSTADQLAPLCKPMRLVTLTRWENESTPRMLGHFIGSRLFSGTQDAWAFIGGRLPRLDHDAKFGIVGCDQIIAGWAAKAGCEVINPSLSIRTFHVHKEENMHDGEETELGLYGYPEITTSSFTDGSVLCHEIPFVRGIDGTVYVEMVVTCHN